jgi:hypothetical protein
MELGECMKAVGVTLLETQAAPEHEKLHCGGALALLTRRPHVFLDPGVGTEMRRSSALRLTHVRTKTIRLCYMYDDQIGGSEM